MNNREKNALLLRELKTAISWHELSEHVKQLVTEYRDRIITKLKSFFSLTPEEKEILHKLPDEVLTQIKENTPPQLQETLEQDITPTVEEVRKPSEERREEKETEELRRREELAKVSPEAAILNAFVPEIYNYGLFFSETSGEHVDASINAFSYLKTMGFITGMWEIGPEHLNCMEEKGRDCCRPHKEVDPNQPICQARWVGGYALADIIDNAYSYANQHSFYPPKAIIALSHPNCYSYDTRVMTNNGFKYFYNVSENDLILSLNPKTREIEYVKWKNKISYLYKGKMYNFIHRGFDALVTPGHNMVYTTQCSNKIRITQAKELVNHKFIKNFRIPRTGKWVGRKSSEYDILLAKFFGWYISEGNVSVRKNRKTNKYQLTISQSEKNQLNRDRIENILINLKLKYWKGKNAFIVVGPFAEWVYNLNLGKSFCKFIPDFIKLLDKEGIDSFLFEYCLGDGHHRERDCFGYLSTEKTYYTSSEKLVADLTELILKSGKSLKIEVDVEKDTLMKFKNGIYACSNNVYCIRESKSNNVLFSSKERNTGINKSRVDIIDYDNMVYCLELEKNNILCFERNGCVGWSGNCKCHISCWIPTTADEIPDSAPGLPTFADPEELLYYKQQALEQMSSFSQDGVSIPVDRWTVLSVETYGNIIRPEEEALREEYKTTPIDWNKPNASQEYFRYIHAAKNWIEDIKPVIIRKGFIYKHAFGLIRPVPDTYFGIQIERNDRERRVFLSDMNYIIKVPDRNIEEVKIKPASSAKPEPHNYIKVDDTYGIIIAVLSDGRIYCYLPEFNEKIFVDSGTIYEIV